MERFKRILRLFRLILVVVFISIGIGLVGGMPISVNSKREDTIDLRAENVDSPDNIETKEDLFEKKA